MDKHFSMVVFFVVSFFGDDSHSVDVCFVLLRGRGVGGVVGLT